MNTHDDASAGRRFEANQLFHEAYEAQLAHDYERAVSKVRLGEEYFPQRRKGRKETL